MKYKEKLDSWKEISRHLHRDVRTCQRWEKELGLPVHRLEGTPRPRVFAFAKEIDAWIEEKHADGTEDSGRPRLASRLKLLGFGALVILIPALLLVLKPPVRSKSPVDFKIVDSKLVMLDARGQELWTFDTGLSNLESDAFYRQHFQAKRILLKGVTQPYLLIEDINGDGAPEVLFSVQTRDEIREGRLYCFSNRGKTLWTLDPGRRMTFGETEYSSAFRIQGLRACDWDGDGFVEILCVGIHAYRFPCRLLLLDHNGKLRGEYCHSGYFKDYEFIDLDGDGRKEIVLAGMNNEWRARCCAVIDPGVMKGASHQVDPEYTCRSLERGTEKFYLVFPNSRLDEQTTPFHTMNLLTFSDKDRRLTLTTDFPPMIFELNYGLELVALTLTHSFKSAYQAWTPEEYPRPGLKEIRREILEKGIRYLSGEEWGSVPAVNPHWSDSLSP